jgi:orotidine-5'-phosphate decarboxylase
MSIDILQEKIIEKQNPTVAGLDPRPEYVPEHIMKSHINAKGETLAAVADAYYEFNCGLIDALCGIVPAVKPQSAYYEMLGWQGEVALAKTCEYARSKGLYVIMDAKRGDIGSTAAAYSQAYLGKVQVGSREISPFACDCVTVNTYLGSDGIDPFIQDCKKYDKSIFALVKTSNPSSGELQDLKIGEQTVYMTVAKLLQKLSAGTEGKYGFTCAGAVVGATYPAELELLRRELPHTFFLVPGYGAQGGGAEDVKHAFNEKGYGAIINSSRAIMCAWKKTGGDGTDYQDAARAEALRMRDDINSTIKIEKI